MMDTNYYDYVAMRATIIINAMEKYNKKPFKIADYHIMPHNVLKFA